MTDDAVANECVDEHPFEPRRYTPHALWKAMCRFMESGSSARRFGDAPLRGLATHAIFEIQGIDDLNLHVDMTEDTPLSLPFPKIVLVFPSFIISIEQPQMDIDVHSMEYRSMLFLPRGASAFEYEQLSFARLRFDLASSIMRREVTATIEDLRAQVQWGDGELFNYPPAEDELAIKLRELIDRPHHFSPDERVEAETALRDFETSVDNDDGITRMRDLAQGFFEMSLRVMLWINQPKHYIVERGPEIVRKPGAKKDDRAARMSERSRYIMIEHEDVRQRWTTAQGSHARPMPHLRRGHFKTLRAERFAGNRGKRIWVSPCHVNGACVEWREGDVTYKVVG